MALNVIHLKCRAQNHSSFPLWSCFSARFHYFGLVKSEKFNGAQTSFQLQHVHTRRCNAYPQPRDGAFSLR